MLLAHSIDALNMFDKEEVGFDSPSTGIGKEKRTLSKLLNDVKNLCLLIIANVKSLPS